MYQSNERLTNSIDLNEIYANYQPYIPSPSSTNSTSDDSLNISSVYSSNDSNDSYNLWYNNYYTNYGTPTSSSATAAASYYYQNPLNYYNNYFNQKSSPILSNSCYNQILYNNSSSPSDFSFSSSSTNQSGINSSNENINQRLKYSPGKDDKEIVQVTNIQESNRARQPQPTQQKTSKSSNDKNYSRKHQLPDKAVDIMNEWFDDHINNPYPTIDDKEKLAHLGGISVKQVTAWFSNRRNRSQNTKPKRMKRDFEKEITNIFNQIESNSHESDKLDLLQKLKTVYF